MSRLGCLGAGGLAGAVGSMIGLGGGIITVPLLRFMGLPQKKASATSLPMVVVGAAAASLSWQLHTPDGVGLDVHGALLMGSMAALCSPLGVRLSMRFQGKYVSRAMGFFMFGMGAFMAFSMVDWDTFTLKEEAEETAPGQQEPVVRPGLTSTPRRALSCAVLGAVVGVAGGAFGVGGGIILVPILTQMSDVQTAAATSLASVIPSTLMSTFVCARNNLVVWRLTPFLIASSTVASFLSAQFAASRLTHTQQKGTFVAVMCSIGTRLMLIKS